MENKKITKLFLEFYPVYGLALGFTYFSNEQEEEEIIEYGKHTSIFDFIFGILNWNMKSFSNQKLELQRTCFTRI